ncbi:hypothetical protein Sa4125_30420 [Aureimonas sp. SA4125]|nr:hypothetical protein Sa4125_30420 [Aureimonas sp. SA4125]
MHDNTLYDEIEAELDRLERIVLGELPDDDWRDTDLEADI